MYAMVVGKNEAMNWNEVEDPIMASDEVLVEIYATAVNRADLLQRQGNYPPPPGAPEWMGLEIAGVIIAIGEDVGVASNGIKWKVGDKVCALLAGGGYAEKVAVSPKLVMPIPNGLTMEQAASLPEVFATAYLNIFIEAGFTEEETVLIQAGASGIGIAAIQLVKAFKGKVLTTVGSSIKVDAVKALGADIIINRNTTSLGDEMDKSAANGYPVNIVLDCVGGEALGENLAKLAKGGRWVLIATLGGITSEILLRSILKLGLKLIGSTLRGRSNIEKEQILNKLTELVWPRIESGEIRPIIYKSFPIEQVYDAHAILERCENIGKVVLKIRD